MCMIRAQLLCRVFLIRECREVANVSRSACTCWAAAVRVCVFFFILAAPSRCRDKMRFCETENDVNTQPHHSFVQKLDGVSSETRRTGTSSTTSTRSSSDTRFAPSTAWRSPTSTTPARARCTWRHTTTPRCTTSRFEIESVGLVDLFRYYSFLRLFFFFVRAV